MTPNFNAAAVPGAHRSAEAASTKGAPLAKPRRRADLDLNTGDRLIDLTALKVAVRVLPTSSAARQLIMEEPDQILMSEYCVKIGIWFKLMRNPTEE